MALAGCKKPSSPAAAPTPEPDAPRAVKVGLIAPLSGEKEVFGRSLRNGVELAVSQINEAGGIGGRPVALVVADSVAATGGIVSAMKTLADAGVVVVIGEVTSGATMEAAATANALGLPLIVPAATQPEISGPGVFRICYVDPLPARVMSTFTLSIGATRAAVMSDPASPYSAGLAAEFVRDFETRGGKIVANETYAAGQTDFASIVETVKAAQPDVVFLPGYFPEAAAILSQARAKGLDVPFLGTDGWEAEALVEKGGKALDNTYITAHFAADDPAVAQSPFVSAFQARFGVAPNSLAALGFDAMSLAADALQRAEAAGGVGAALSATEQFDGVTGTIHPAGTGTKPAVILRIEGGKFTYLQTIY